MNSNKYNKNFIINVIILGLSFTNACMSLYLHNWMSLVGWSLCLVLAIDILTSNE